MSKDVNGWQFRHLEIGSRQVMQYEDKLMGVYVGGGAMVGRLLRGMA